MNCTDDAAIHSTVFRKWNVGLAAVMVAQTAGLWAVHEGTPDGCPLGCVDGSVEGCTVG